MLSQLQSVPVASWISPKTKKGLQSPIQGKGFFAVQDINAGEIVAKKGGHLINRETLKKNASIIRDSQAQIDDDLYLAPLTDEEFEQSMIYINHSCDPNVGECGLVDLTTIRDVKAGEELTMDYAMYFADDLNMECTCGSENCRKVITGNDWRLPELQQRYGDHFTTFILNKIRDNQSA